MFSQGRSTNCQLPPYAMKIGKSCKCLHLFAHVCLLAVSNISNEPVNNFNWNSLIICCQSDST